MACGILVSWSGIGPMPPALEAWSLNHWTAREIPGRVSRLVSRWRQTYFSLFKGGRQVLGNVSKLGCCWKHRDWTRYGKKNPVMLLCTREKGTAHEGQSKGGLKVSRGELRVHAPLLLGRWSLWVTLLIIRQRWFLPCPQKEGQSVTGTCGHGHREGQCSLLGQSHCQTAGG